MSDQVHLTNTVTAPVTGWWSPTDGSSHPGDGDFAQLLRRIHQPLSLVNEDGTCTPRTAGTICLGTDAPENGIPLAAYAPPCSVEQLGDASFCHDLGIRYPYIAGSMAKGISSAAIVEEMGHAGMLGFFGAAGLPLAQVEAAIDRISASLGDRPYGFNLIHSPNEPDLESAIVDLYLRRQVRLVEASAFLDLTLQVVRYRLHGIHKDAAGNVVTPNRVIAKVSREEIAAKFFAPPPEAMVAQLVASGDLTDEQAQLAASIPMAQDITAEADSGGHTDNRPAVTLFPTICAVRDRAQRQYGFAQRLRVGLAGGIGTPDAAAAAFSMGAAYIMTGSVNQACVESGTSDEVRQMLTQTRQADVTMAPAADMFEMGVDVQVLKRGTMFSMRAAKLFDLYRNCASIDDLPKQEREKLEKTLFRATLEDIWQQTREFFLERDRRQVEKAERDPKHRMALVFRWYLGQAPHWANQGDASRKIDYQVWCGPAMGAFNEWTRGSFLEQPENRRVVPVAHNILFGAAVIMRISSLRCQGVELPAETCHVLPLKTAQIEEYQR